ncbi:MAG: DUF192 domain-containing protein, partial [Solirubrobacterales bacterium]
LWMAEVLGIDVQVATSPGSRLIGLACLDRTRAGAWLFIPRCRSVHTFGMRFELDVYFIDADGLEIHSLKAVPPRQILRERQAVGILEVPSQGKEGSSA